MVASSAAISRLLELLPVACKYLPINIGVNSNFVDTSSRFAFVEYESRRDADDAYHEMHNKRLGRDDILKIEVRLNTLLLNFLANANLHSGPAHLRLLPGALIPVVTVNVLLVVAPLAMVVAPLLPDVVVVVISLLARMIAETETTIAETAVIARAALTIG